ncbi:MAG: glycoside hydrolase family 20 zincin-like fold domain-containing protein [Candidatus Brocadiia bacterium]
MAVLVALAAPVLAAEPALLQAYKAPTPKLDGALEDPCWAWASTAFPFLVPAMNSPAVEETRLMLSFDDHRLYAGFECACRDSQKLRVGDGDPTLNDHVEFIVTWTGAPGGSVVVDAAGRLECSEGLQEVQAAVGRGPDSYLVEIAIPRPPATRELAFVATRYSETTGEVSTWGTERVKARARLSAEPGPAVQIKHMARRPRGDDAMEITAINPCDSYSPLRCRIALESEGPAVPHLVRLGAGQTITTKIHYTEAMVRRGGLQLVFDQPQGQEVYLRSPAFRLPPGRAPLERRIDVIPHPQRVTIDREGPPFVLDRRCCIIVGRRRNRIERQAAELLQEEIRRICGLELRIRRATYFLRDRSIVVATDRTTLLAKRLAQRFLLDWAELEAPDQTYLLGIDQEIVGVAGLNDVGTLYGAHTLAQILASSPHDEGKVWLPQLKIRDYPSLALRGHLWRTNRPELPALYPALSRFKVNLLTGISERHITQARMHGIYNAALGLPEARALGVAEEPATVRLTPPDTMARPLMRALLLPVALEEAYVQPPPQPTEEELEEMRKQQELEERLKALAESRRRRGSRWGHAWEPVPVREPEEVEPLRMGWVRGDPAALKDVAPAAAARQDVVGICGGLDAGPSLLPPSWAQVVAAAEYGWSPRTPPPEHFRETFAQFFYGSAEVGEARDLLERAVACLPRQTDLGSLLSDIRPVPGAPRDDLPQLVAEACRKAQKATRNAELAQLLVQAGPRVLVAATNVAAARRVRQLYAEARELEEKQERGQVAQRLEAISQCLADGRAQAAKHLGAEAESSPTVELYSRAAAAAKRLAGQVAGGAPLPSPARFWPLLRGGAP